MDILETIFFVKIREIDIQLGKDRDGKQYLNLVRNNHKIYFNVVKKVQ